MIPDYPVGTFDEPTLKSVISCAILMSSIDGIVDQKEWDIIQSFVDKHWKEDYQDFSRFKATKSQEIESLVKAQNAFQFEFSELVEKLTTHLSSPQKNIVLNLVGDVMVADGIMTLEESKLFATFMDKLGIRIG